MGLLDQIIFTSDFGAKANGVHVEDGMEMFFDVFRNNGFNGYEFEKMASKNAAERFGIDLVKRLFRGNIFSQPLNTIR